MNTQNLQAKLYYAMEPTFQDVVSFLVTTLGKHQADALLRIIENQHFEELKAAYASGFMDGKNIQDNLVTMQ